MAILGDDERARGEVAIKDLRTGEQKSVARSEAAAFIKARSVGSGPEASASEVPTSNSCPGPEA